MKRFMIVTAFIAVMALSVTAEVPIKAKVGYLMGDFSPTFIYTTGVEFGAPAFLKPLIETGQAEVFYSGSADHWKTGEIYGVRVAGKHDFAVWGKLYVETGLSTWYFINSEGADVGRAATTAGLGYLVGPIDISLSGDAIAVKNGDDMYAAHLGLSIGL